MISVRRPSAGRIEGYRAERESVAPPCPPAEAPPDGFRTESFRRTIGSGDHDLATARTALQEWGAHRGSGVEVFPRDASVAEGETVAIVTRQMGLWVLAACRVVSVVDGPSEFGFTYATLPGHPECGYESFTVRRRGDDVAFEVEAVSRPGIALVRLGAPVTRILQRRASEAYLGAMHDRVLVGRPNPGP